MSSLTDEQKKRIEENRARALARLAEKKSLAQTQNQNKTTAPKHCNNSTVNTNTFYTKPHSSSSETTNTSPHKIQDLSRFEYHRNTSKTSSHKAPSKGTVNRNVQSERTSSKSHDNKTKNVNDALMKARVVSGTCVLTSRTRFKVEIGFHAKLIGVLKSIPSKCYDSQTRTWNFLLEDYEMLMSLCKPLASEVKLSGFPKEVARLFLSQKMKCPIDSESDIKWDLIDKKLVDSLMPFQKEGVIFSIKQNGRVLLADDMGLGKTIQAIAVAAYYRTKWPLLIVVPSSLRMTWRRSLIRWLPSVKPQQVNVVLTGKDSPNVGLVNVISYDLLVKKIREIQKVGYKVVIVDECHAIKNLKTERTKCMMPLLKASSHVILVSGTPALSRPSELYTQISAVNPKLFPSYHQYGIRYCAGVKSHFGWDYSGSSNMEELQLILEECIMIRRLKKLVLDQLPSKTREVVYLDPSLIKEKSLEGAEKQLVKAKPYHLALYPPNYLPCVYTNCDKGRSAFRLISVYLKLKDRRSALLEYFNDTSSVKATAVREYLMDLLEGGHKLIVFAHHRHMLDVISETLLKKKIGYIRIDGKTLSARRQHLCDQFQRDSETKAAVLSLTAANTGLTLTAATCVVFAELFWNPGVLVQAEDRAYRIGQKNSVVIHYLIARKTADDYLWPMIQKKLDVLSEAGLSKENFSDLDSKTFQNTKQRDLKDLLESMIQEFEENDSFFEECLKDDNSDAKFHGGTSITGLNTTKTEKEKANLWSDRIDCGETSQTSSDYAESSQGSLTNYAAEDCSNEGTNTTGYNAGKNKKLKAKLWSERGDNSDTSQTSSANAESSQGSSMNDSSEAWFDRGSNTTDYNASNNRKEKAKLWSERSDGKETLKISNANTESSQESSMNDISEAWFDEIDDDWDNINFYALDNTIEPNAKRKRL